MAHLTCRHIKRDGTVCGNNSWRPTGCYRHWKLYEKNIEKKPCIACGFPTASTTGCCPKHSAKFHALNYRMRQKYGVEVLHPGKLLN